MRSGELRETVKFQRRAVSDDGYGNTEAGEWADLFGGATFQAKIRPASGRSDSVMAARRGGVNTYDVWMRQDSRTRTVTGADRLVWTNPPVGTTLTLQILGEPVDPDGTRAELHILAQSGVAT